MRNNLTKKELSNIEYCKGLIESLQKNVIRMKFLKLDGNLRDMLCTRNTRLIESFEGKSDRAKEINSNDNIDVQIKKDAIIVYDLESKGFRAFKPSRLVQGSWEEISVNDYSSGNIESSEDSKKEIIELLINNEVDIIFTKIDGSERLMKATRKDNYEPRMVEINKPEEIKKQVESGKVPVFDLDINEMRAFNLGRLKSYKLVTDTDYIEVDFSAEKVLEEVEKLDDKDILNPQKLTTAELINTLNTKVVRLLFTKKDGSIRVMYGTRDCDIVDLYSKKGAAPSKKEDSEGINSNEKVNAQINGDYVTIFDLEDRVFKTFKPSTLLKFDVERGVGSWIEFKTEDDGWFQVVYEGRDIKDFYVKGDWNAKEIGEEVSVKRLKFEYKQKEYKDLRDNLKTRGDEPERLASAMKIIDSVVKVENKDLTSSDLMVYNKLKELGNKVKEKYEEADNKEMVLTEVKVLDSKKLVVFSFNWGRDVFIFHPKFALNGVTYKVYADRTGKIKFDERARISKAEKNFLPILKMVVPVISKRRKKDKLDSKLNEVDLRRMRRAFVISKAKEDLVDDLGLKFEFKSDNGVPSILRITTTDGKKNKLLITPAYVYEQSKKLMIHDRQNDWTTLKEFVENVYKKPGVLGLSPEQCNIVVKILALAFDLRKPVFYKDKKI